MDPMKCEVDAWLQRESFDLGVLHQKLLDANTALLDANDEVAKLHDMTGTGYWDHYSGIDLYMGHAFIVNDFVRSMATEIEALDEGLFTKFNTGPTHDLAEIKWDQFTTSMGAYDGHPAIPGGVNFLDFYGNVSGAIPSGYFDKMLMDDYESWAADNPDSDDGLASYLNKLISMGEYDHEEYNPVGSFISNLLDITGVWLIIKSIWHYDPITGNHLSDAQAAIGLVMGLVNMACLATGGLAGFAAGGLKEAALAALREMALNAVGAVAATITTEIATELGLPAWVVTLLALGVGITVGIVGTKYVMHLTRPDGTILDVPLGKVEVTDVAGTPHVTVDGVPVPIQQSSAFRAAEAARTAATTTRTQAVANLQQAKKALLDLLPSGTTIPDLTVKNIDATASALRNKYITGDSALDDAIDEAIENMRVAAWAERRSLTGLKDASEELGTQAARDAIESMGGKVLIDGTGTQFSGANTFDVVGLSADGKTLLIVEAKGGSSELSKTGRIIGYDALGNPVRAPQGSVEYLNNLLTVDKNLKNLLKNSPELAEGLRNGTIKIEYQLAKASGDGTSFLSGLVSDQSQIDLSFLG